MISAGFQLSSASANSPFEQYSSKLPASVRGALNHTTGWIFILTLSNRQNELIYYCRYFEISLLL
jgi:hypothetical protein